MGVLYVVLTWKLLSTDWTAAAWFLHLDLPLRERMTLEVHNTTSDERKKKISKLKISSAQSKPAINLSEK